MSKVKKGIKKFAQKKAKGQVQFKKKHHHGHKRSGGGKKATAAADELQQQQKQAPPRKRLEEMDLDEFLDGGFEDAALADKEAAGSGDEHPDSEQLAGSEDGEADNDLDDLQPTGSEEEDEGAAAAAAGAGGNEEESESDDDDDVTAAAGDGSEAAAVAADNMKLKGAVSRHKQQLEALKAKDPEFYAYLQASDAGLLGFGEGESDLEEEEEEDSEQDSDDEPAATAAAAAKKPSKADKAAAKKAADAEEEEEDEEQQPEASEEEEEDGDGGEGQPAGGVHVTSSMVDGWCKAAQEKASMGAMMQLVKAYRVACHYGDTEQQLSSSLSISSGAVFNRVMLFMLKEADGIFRRMLGLPADASSAAAAAAAGGKSAGVLLAEQVAKAQRWRKVEPLVKSYLGNSLHLLASMTQPEMTAYTLRRLRPSAAFFGPYPRLTKKLLKLGLEIFGSGEKENAPRLQALLLVRQMALVLPPPALQTVLRGAYRAYAANAKFVSPSSLPALAFMAAGVVELSSLDLSVTYQVGFVSIRELAVLLRNALAAKTQDAHKEVYCWQTLNCLELWVKVLAAAAPQGTLQPLVYPLSQLLLGATRLVPTPRYFPIRLRLVRALNRLGQATGVYIPVSPLLLEMLHWSELRRTPTGGAAAAPDMLLLLRLSKAQLKLASLQEEVVSQVLELLADHLRQWATSVSFPEAAHLPCVALRGFIKGCAVERFRRAAKQLVDALERNISYVGSARDNVSFAPQDLAAAAHFLSADSDRAKSPLVQFANQLLQKAAARMAMRSSSTQELQLGEQQSGGKRKRQQQEAEEEEDHDAADDGDLAKLMAAGEHSEGEEDEEALAGAAKKMIRQKEKRLKRAAAAAAAAGRDEEGEDEEAGEDKLADYQLSDEDDDSEGAAGAAEGDEAAYTAANETRGGSSKGGKQKKQDGRRQQQQGRQMGRKGKGAKGSPGGEGQHGGHKKGHTKQQQAGGSMQKKKHSVGAKQRKR